MSGDEPGCVVVGDERLQRATQALDGVEGLHPEEVLLQGTDEAFRDAVALGLPDEGWRALDAEEGDLGLEAGGHVVRAMVVPECQAFGDDAADRAEVAPDGLADRLERLEAVAGPRDMVAGAFAGAVVDGDEHPRPALPDGHGLGHVGAPHDVDRVGGDGAGMLTWLGPADTVRREQAMLTHQPPDPPGGGADAGMAQPGPDLAVALAVQA